MHQGWPRHFGAFDIGDPYVLRSFSESIRLLMGRESSNGNEPSEKIFPKEGRLRDALEQMIDASIFYGASVEQAQVNLRKQFRLNVAGGHLPSVLVHRTKRIHAFVTIDISPVAETIRSFNK